MSLRRVALAMVVALVAMTSAIGASAARASSGTICVALVVDGRALGSNVSTTCATVARGATGVDVLQKAGHTVGFRNDGLICTIDGLPKSGCTAVDDSHFWAYFHRAPGATSWTYSTEGPSTYQPANTSTDGWVYRDGTSAMPENVPYAKVCPPATTKTTSPAPSPSHHPTHPPRHHHHSSAAPTHHHVATPRPRSDPTPSATAHGASKRPSRRHVHRRHHSGHRLRPTTELPNMTPPPTISPSSAALLGGYSTTGGGGSSSGLIVGVVAVVVLGGAAAYRFRRSSGRP